MNRLAITNATLAITLILAGCGGDDEEISSDEEARRAYLGLDLSIEKSLNLGMDGYNAADNANIPDQESVGDVDGTIVVGGQVDAGSSDNKEMRLYITMVAYTDGPFIIDEEGEEEAEIIYSTDEADLPYLELSLRDSPDGTFTGALVGTYEMVGHLEGSVTLDLTMSGEIEDAGDGTMTRVVGSTDVTGTATSGDGLYEVAVTL